MVDCDATGDSDSAIMVSSDTSDPDSSNDSSNSITTIDRESEFTVSFTGLATVFSGNGPVTYDIGLDNAGPSSGTNVVLSFLLDDGVIDPMLSEGTCIFSSPYFNCTFDEIACSTSNTYTLTVDIPLETTASISHSLTVSGDLGTEDDSDNSVSLTQNVNLIDLDISVSGTIVQRPIGPSTPMVVNTPAVPGEDVEIIVTVFNNDPGSGAPLRSATQVEFTITPDINLLYNSASTSVNCDSSAGNINCILPDIQGDSAFEFSLFFTVDPSVVNTQTLSSLCQISAAEQDVDSSNNQNEFSFPANTVADLIISISRNQTIETVGSFIDYIITFSNDGPSNANNVRITHSHPPSTLTLAQAPSATTLGILPGSGVVDFTVLINSGVTVVTIPLVAVDEEFTIISRVLIDPAFRDTEQVESTVSIASDEFDPEAASSFDADAAFLRVFANVDITLGINPPSLDASPPTAALGETITLNSFITNDGPSDATVVDLNYFYNNSVLIWSNNPRVLILGTSVSIFCQPAAQTNALARIQCFLQEILIDRNQISNLASISLPYQVLVDFTVANANIAGSTDIEVELQFNEFDSDLQDNTESVQLNIGQADLSVVLSGGPSPTVSGSLITFSAIVANGGSETATSVQYQQTIPANIGSITDIQGPNCQFNEASNLLTCNLPDLPPSSTETISVDVRILDDATGSLVSTATIFSDQFDSDLADRSSQRNLQFDSHLDPDSLKFILNFFHRDDRH